MSRSKYRICRLTLVIPLLLLLSACNLVGGDREQVSFMVFGDPAEFNAYQKLVDAFHEEHPEIEVELIHVPSQTDYRTRLATDFAAGSPPDVTLMNYRRYAAFAAEDQLEPIGPYLDESDLISEKDFYPVSLQGFIWNGQLMCLPQNLSSLVIYYNEDLFDAAGVPYPPDKWSWDEFLATAQALTKDLDGDGDIDQYGIGMSPELQRLAPFVWQNGGPIVDDDAQPRRTTLARPPSLEAFQWFVDLRLEHGVVPTRAEEASQDSESRFMNGTIGMFFNSRRGTPTYREIESFSWAVAPLPSGETSASILHSDAYCLSAATENKGAAWTFIEFANSVEGQTIVAGSGRTVPSLISVAESKAFLDPTQAPARSRVFLDAMNIMRLVPVISTWNEIESTANEEIDRAFYGDITVEEAANLIFQRTEEYFLLGEYAGKP
jgi:multiple sugar transport system substrate-binding protein